MKPTQFGIQTYTIRHALTTPEDFETSMQRLSDMGYTILQTRPTAFWDGIQLAAVLKKYGMQADSAFSPLYEIPERIDVLAKEAEALKTDVLRTDSIAPEDRYSVEGYKKAAAHLNVCGKLLYERGIRFMYHFHSFEYIKLGETRGIDILLNETDPKYVWFQPDVFWLQSAGTEPSVELRRYKGRAEYMHLKDYCIAPNGTTVLEKTKAVSCPVGTGNLNWDAIIKTAKEIGIWNFVLEDDMGVLDPFESARISIENMKKMGF